MLEALSKAFAEVTALRGALAKLRVEDVEEEVSQCANCHEYFHPKMNGENSCQYHPGMMKFYSCRSCGADPYYVCCMKCSDCCKGCRIQRHVC